MSTDKSNNGPKICAKLCYVHNSTVIAESSSSSITSTNTNTVTTPVSTNTRKSFAGIYNQHQF